MDQGHADPRAALDDARGRWPGAVDPSRTRDGPALAVTDLPPGCEVTVVRPRRRDGGSAWVEMAVGLIPLDVAMDASTVEFLVGAGALRPHSSSGSDPSLGHRYDHYVGT